MRIARISASFLIVFGLLCPLLAASGFESPGIGLKARGMAGAFRAVADDWTAAFYNPAGYADLYDNQLGANLSLVHLRDEVTPNYRWGGVWPTGIINDRPLYNNHEITSNPSSGFAIRLPVWGETVVGLSIYQPFDYRVTWNLYQPFQSGFIFSDSVAIPADQFRTDIDVVAFQLTAAREFIEDKLSLGLGLQILRADLVYNEILLRDNPLKNNPDNPADSLLAVRPWDKIPEWSHNDGKGWGFGLKAGAMLKSGDKFKLAVTASLPFDITLSGGANLLYFMPKIRGTGAFEGTLQFLFTDGGKIVDTADFEVKLKLPPSIATGLSYALTEKLTLAFDAEYTFWSRFEGLSFTYDNHRGMRGSADTSALARDFFTADISRPVDWDNAGKVMGGVSFEYTSWLTLLGGVSADQSPARSSSFQSPNLVDTGDKYSFSGGFIAHINQWDVGLITSYTSFPDLAVGGLVDLDNDGIADNFPGAYKADTYETVLAFNYRF